MSCCLPDKIVVEIKYNKCKLSINHAHLLGKIQGLQTNKVSSNNQHNYKKNKSVQVKEVSTLMYK